eukprot:GHVU01133852.1.p1 GENE.GHVU01133852.1~~GHVU01133852.1.p1  ORF type:complete len:135 (-),score=8.09 GHVU01133852.1:103-507(-)
MCLMAGHELINTAGQHSDPLTHLLTHVLTHLLTHLLTHALRLLLSFSLLLFHCLPDACCGFLCVVAMPSRRRRHRRAFREISFIFHNFFNSLISSSSSSPHSCSSSSLFPCHLRSCCGFYLVKSISALPTHPSS